MKTRKKFLIGIFAVLLIISGLGMMFKKSEREVTAEVQRSKSYGVIEQEDKTVENSNDCIEFYAFFLEDIDSDGYAEEIKGSCKNITSSNTLYMSLNVLSEGYLKDGKLTLNAENMSWTLNMLEDEVIGDKYVNSSSKIISLQEKIEAGCGSEIEAEIKSAIGSNINDYTAVNSITLTGTYVDGEGNESEINKTSEFTVDWYGTVSAYVKGKTDKRKISNLSLDSSGIDISFSATTYATTNLILKQNHVEVTMVDLNGYYPMYVDVSNQGITYDYDEENHVLTIDKEGSVDSETGDVKKQISSQNSYYITVTYPVDAFQNQDDISLNYTVKSWYSAYNNQTEEFDNPCYSATSMGVSSVIYSTENYGTVEVPQLPTYKITIGKYISSYDKYVVSKDKVINLYDTGLEDEEEDTYTVNLYFNEGSENYTYLKLDEYQEDKILGNGQYYDLTDYVSIKGIYFLSPGINKNGNLKLYNEETGELIETFTYSELCEYNSESNLYEIDEDIERIAVETSDFASTISMQIVKKIDDVKLANDYTEEEFNSFSKIYTYATYSYAKDKTINVKSHQNVADYSERTSRFSVSTISSIEAGETLENQTMTIQTTSSEYNEKGWINGKFLVKLPENIAYFNVNTVETKDASVSVEGYDVYKQDGCYFLEIYLTNNTEANYLIYINYDIGIEQTESSKNIYFDVYGANESSSQYLNSGTDIYDINSNFETTDNVGKITKSISVETMNSVLTSQKVTNYDDEENVTFSPGIADIRKEQGTADINLNLYNNSKYAISEIQILGVVPFEGNLDVSTNKELGSEYTVTMKDTGIVLPETVKEYATIYYSEKDEVTKDLEDEENAWTTTPEDWSKVKYYLIDFGEYTASVGSSLNVQYTVEIPNDLDYSKVTYSSYMVYYSSNTTSGKHATKRSASKVGLRIARKYNLNITKYSTEGINTVSRATYEASENEGNLTKFATTNSQGISILRNLYVDTEYTFKETNAAINYMLNTDEVVFEVNENENGELVLNVKSNDNFRDEIIIDNETSNIYANVEDEPQYQLQITKKDEATGELLPDVKFGILGREGSYTTNAEGITTIYYLNQHETYTLKETKSTGYYLMDSIDFQVDKSENGNYIITSDNEQFKNATVNLSNNGDMIVVCVELTNEKRPMIEITKIDEETEEILQGVKIQDTSTNKIYTTDENGKVEIYFDENKEYTIKEIKADGYYLEEITFKIVTDENGSYKIESENEDFANATVIDQANKILSVTLNNEKIPTYTLQIKKVDSDSKETLLQGAEFQLSKIDTNEIEEYETDENGMITLSGLYAFVDEKNITAEYILQEKTAPEGYSNNAEEILFRVQKNNDGELLFDLLSESSTIAECSIEENVVTLIIKDKPLFRLTKKDSETGELLANAQFLIYEIDDDGNVLDYAKDVNGDYVGEKNDEGQWIVITDENGVIALPLKDGNYAIMEVGYPEGYLEKEVVEYFKVGSKTNENENYETDETNVESIYEINYIEDLVDFSNSVNGGKDYLTETVTLERTLDFTSDDSYRNPEDTSYGDINEDGTIEGIKAELTNMEAIGFTPIGNEIEKVFSGTFDGQGFEIQNIYINSTSRYVGLFGCAAISKIKDLGVTGNIIIDLNLSEQSNNNVGGIVGTASGCTIENCYGEVNINVKYDGLDGANGTEYVGGIVGNISSSTIENCCNIANSINVQVANNSNTIYLYVGGISGEIAATTVTYSHNTSNITITDDCDTEGCSIKCYIGGTISSYQGSSSYCELSNCYNEGNINVTSDGYACVYGSSGSTNCYNTGDIDVTTGSDANVYGSSGSTNCYNEGNINVTSDGYAYVKGSSGSKNCYNTGDIDVTAGKTQVYGSSGSTNCYNEGNINVTSDGYAYVHGSYDFNSLTNCYNTGDIDVISDGYTEVSGMSTNSSVTNCYNTGDINVTNNSSEDSYVGGIFASRYSNETITNCYNTGNISSQDSNGQEKGYVGKLVAAKSIKSTFTVKNSYYLEDTELIGKNKITYGESKTSEYMKTQSFVEDLGTEYYSLDNDNINNGYPVLLSSEEESVTIENFEIYYIEDLVELSDLVNSGTSVEKVLLMQTLDFNDDNSYKNPEDTSYGDINEDGTIEGIKQELTNTDGYGFKPIGDDSSSYRFSGIFDGQSYEINNIFINRSGNVGLFANVDKAIIINVGISGTIKGNQAGGLVGKAYNYLKMNNCYNNAEIQGTSSSFAIGGLIGYSNDYTYLRLENCYNNGKITASSYAGGIIGVVYFNNFVIENCYNNGIVNSNSAGGIAGEIYGYNYDVTSATIKNCYNSGDITGGSYGVGGIAGVTELENLEIYNSYNIGNITASSYAGGIIGFNISGEYKIEYCYNLGNLSSNADCGGIIGANNSYNKYSNEINNCYNSGSIVVQTRWGLAWHRRNNRKRS